MWFSHGLSVVQTSVFPCRHSPLMLTLNEFCLVERTCCTYRHIHTSIWRGVFWTKVYAYIVTGRCKPYCLLWHQLTINQVIQTYEASFCSCAVFPDPETLATGSHDSKVRLWRLTHREQTNFSLLYILTGHKESVMCVAASRAWSLIVSGGEDGCAMLWELNRAQYVRAIDHGAPVHLAAINESTVSYY